MKYIEDYSENEKVLFSSIGMCHLMEHMFATDLYRLAIDYVFINNLSGPNIEALRKAAKAIGIHKPYRLSSQFEELIKF